MARSGVEGAAINRANALMTSEVLAGGGKTTIRVAVRHTDDDHDCAATFHYGPPFSDEMAGVIAHVRGVAPGDVDLVEEAKIALERAKAEYPESDGWEVTLEAIVPHEDNVGDEDDKHVVRKLEG